MKNTCTYLRVRSYTRTASISSLGVLPEVPSCRTAILFAELTGLDPSLVYDGDVRVWSKLICGAARVLCRKGVA